MSSARKRHQFLSKYGTQMQALRALAQVPKKEMSPYEQKAILFHGMTDEALTQQKDNPARSGLERMWADEILAARKDGHIEKL